jgi:hypothetical protein
LKPADKELLRERLKNPNMPYLAKKSLKKKILGNHDYHGREKYSARTFHGKLLHIKTSFLAN